MILAAEELVPPATVDPAAVWVFNWVIPIVGTIFLVLAIADVARRRRFTWGFLFLINSMAVYWMETIGDWGQMLYYSPAFAEHHLLDWLPIKTPNDPLFMPFAYSVYWGVHALLVLWLSQWVASRFNWSMLKALLVLAIPVNYVWDLVVEGTAAAMGWWTYDPGLGPLLEFSNGGRITLVWTVGLMCVWPNLIAYWCGKPPVRGLNHFERFCRLDRFIVPKAPTPATVDTTRADGSGAVAVATKRGAMTKEQEYDSHLNYKVTISRWRFEWMRMGAWFVGFQVSFFLLLVVPLVALRAVLGADSTYIP